MKKVAGFIVSALLLFPLSADASVNTQKDNSGTTTYISQVNYSGPWDSVKLQAGKEKTLPIITLTLADPSFNNPTYHLFSDKTQLVADGKASNVKLNETYRNREGDVGIFELTPAQIASIQNAKKVSLRVSFYNTSDINWNVSEKVLNEWKEVLGKGKNQISLRNTPTDMTIHSSHHVR